MPSRSPKRKRIDSQLTFNSNDAQTDKHAAFTAWSQNCGVEVSGVKPSQLPGRGVGLVTTRRIRKNERLLIIPGKAIFTPDKSLLKQANLLAASPQAQLAISALHSFTDSSNPAEYGIWQATWPTRRDLEESLPMCWPHPLRDLLPPSVKPALERACADYGKDWAAVKTTCDAKGWSQAEFRYYWMIVNSRSFHWCASSSKPGTMVMCPFVDYTNHGSSGSGCVVSQSTKGYDVVADRDYDAGTEILATYGAHSNDKLLVHYGFILSSSEISSMLDDEAPRNTNTNTDDSISLDHLILPHLTPEVQSALRDVGYLGNYVLSIPTNNPGDNSSTSAGGDDSGKPELCFKTQVAVRAALRATNNEWEYFAGSGEDLGKDRSADVEMFVAGLLEGFKKQAMDTIKTCRDLNLGSETGVVGNRKEDDVGGAGCNLEGWRGDLARQMVISRWLQIVEAIDQFGKDVD